MTDSAGPVSEERLEAWRRLARPRRRSGETASGAPSDLSDFDPEADPAVDRRRQAQAGRLVRGVLRRRSLLDALLARPACFDPARTAPEIQWVLRLAAYEKIFQSTIPDYAIGAQAVALARKVAGERPAGFVNAAMRKILGTLPVSPEALAADPGVAKLPASTRWSIPEPILKALSEGYGAEAMDSLIPVLSQGEAPVWLRANTLHAAAREVRDSLQLAGVAAETPPALESALPEALLWSGGESLPWKTPAWERGDLTVQDFGAMLAAALLDPKPGESVLDACAAPGGKTGHLWQKMEGRGRLVALEADPERRQALAAALARLFGADHKIEIPASMRLESAPPGAFDRVLLDAPCLALGLIGRHPEIRWDDRLRDAQRVVATQKAILAAGAARTRPGGRLLWATCSPTRIENEGVAGDWLNTHPDWRLVEPAEVLAPELLTLASVRDGWLRTRPDRLPCDGFAMALLERNAAS